MSLKHTLRSTVAVALALVSVSAVEAQTPNDVQDFTSHGIHVILRSTKANQVVSAITGFEGGLAYGETNNASIAGGTAAVIAESGSKKYPKELFRDQLAKLSTSIAGSGGLYNMSFTLQTVRPNFDEAWNIFSDLLVNPNFDTLEAQKLQEQQINAIQGRSADPDSYTSYLADSLWSASSKLNRVPTVEEVEAMTIGDLQTYRSQQFQRSRMLMVIVGDVSRAEIEKKLAALDPLPAGNFTWRKIETIDPAKGQYLFINRDLPTTYIEMKAPSAYPGSQDWWAQRVMFEIMDKRLFDQVRTKRNLAYSPSGYANGTFQNFASTFTLQSVHVDSATNVVFDVIRGLQNNLVSKQDLENAKASRITTYYYATQKNLAQARAIFTNQEQSGDWRLFFKIVPETQKVTAEQVRAVARKYLHNFNFVLMGPEGSAKRDIYRFD